MVFCFEPMLVKYEFGTACWEDIWWVTSDRVERSMNAAATPAAITIRPTRPVASAKA